MGLLEAVFTQHRVWKAYARLGSPVHAEREQAMQALRQIGSPSLPALRLGLRQVSQPRVQFAAAIVLHRLGDESGLSTLTEALLWRLPSSPEIAAELETALVAIGSPDATRALITIWNHLTDWSDHHPTIESICRVWAALRDPRALDALVLHATSIPSLFLQTVPWFGEMAVLHLERMLREPELPRRLLAIQTLGRISSDRGFEVLTPLLRDPSPDVRSAVPSAMEAMKGGPETAKRIVEALQAGYSSAEAVELLTRLQPQDLHELLLELLARWDGTSPRPSGDTQTAIIAALLFLGQSPRQVPRLVAILCTLLERRPSAPLAAAAARTLGAVGKGHPSVIPALLPLMGHAEDEVRREASEALQNLGETLGRHVSVIIAECRPTGSLLGKLQAILRGGPDAGQAATQAVQQVTQWLSRVSKETVVKLNPSGAGGFPAALPHQDRRLPELLRLLLANALDALQQAITANDMERMLTLSVAAVRALMRLETPEALCARFELLRALTITKFTGEGFGFGMSGFANQPTREIADPIRTAAAEALHYLYGPASFVLFLEALYRPQSEVHGTAIAALGHLGDLRAVPHLQPIAGSPQHSCTLAAQIALEEIKRTNPEMMTLLRASSAGEARPDTLLRPAYGVSPDVPADQLLRPTAQHPVATPEVLPPNAVTE